MISRALRILLLGLLGGYTALFVMQLGFTRFYAQTKPLPENADIVVLGHTYLSQLQPRIETGAALFHKAGGHRLIVTGQTIADLMAGLAEQQGVPAERILQEAKARSTLQNALFVRQMLPLDARPVVLISDQSHLLRAWVSFRWAGFAEVHIRPSAEPRWDLRNNALEAFKWLVNLARMAAVSVLHALGTPPERYAPLLI